MLNLIGKFRLSSVEGVNNTRGSSVSNEAANGVIPFYGARKAFHQTGALYRCPIIDNKEALKPMHQTVAISGECAYYSLLYDSRMPSKNLSSPSTRVSLLFAFIFYYYVVFYPYPTLPFPTHDHRADDAELIHGELQTETNN